MLDNDLGVTSFSGINVDCLHESQTNIAIAHKANFLHEN